MDDICICDNSKTGYYNYLCCQNSINRYNLAINYLIEIMGNDLITRMRLNKCTAIMLYKKISSQEFKSKLKLESFW